MLMVIDCVRFDLSVARDLRAFGQSCWYAVSKRNQIACEFCGVVEVMVAQAVKLHGSQLGRLGFS